MGPQNKQLIDWGGLLLAGVIALVITTKVHAIKYYEWIFLLLSPAASFLLCSLWAGVVFQRRAAYLAIQTNSVRLDSLNELLGLQSQNLAFGLMPLSIFALVFLSAIILGYLQPFDAK
jgi:hypothetical protein